MHVCDMLTSSCVRHDSTWAQGCSLIHESCVTYEWVMVHTWMSRTYVTWLTHPLIHVHQQSCVTHEPYSCVWHDPTCNRSIGLIHMWICHRLIHVCDTNHSQCNSCVWHDSLIHVCVTWLNMYTLDWAHSHANPSQCHSCVSHASCTSLFMIWGGYD